MASPNYFVATVLATSPRREQAEKLFDSVRDLMRTNRSPLFEVARPLVRFEHVASFILNANHSAM
jgi:hypothetical protein